MAEFGSFGNVSPEGMQAIKEALVRRGMGDSSPALNQQSGASPTPAPIPPQPMGGVSPSPSGGSMPSPAGMPPAENQEARLIVSALKDRLKAISEVEVGPKTPNLG